MSNESVINPAISVTQGKLELINNLIAEKDFVAVIAEIEQIPVTARTPLLQSGYALAMAEVKGSFKASINLCHDAIKKDTKNPEHYFRQGWILVLAGRRKDAIWILRMGLRQGRHRGIIDMLASLGIRRPPPLTFLARSNPLNKMLGIIMTKLNLR